MNQKFEWVEGDLSLSLCPYCRFKTSGKPNCKAFPDGIPQQLLDGTISHDHPIEGDHDIQYSQGKITPPASLL